MLQVELQMVQIELNGWLKNGKSEVFYRKQLFMPLP